MPIEFKELPIDKIIIVENNPRQISQEDLDNLCRDIEKDSNFLQQRPSLINFTNGKYYCYAGCQRIKAQKVLGRKTAPCFIETDVPIKVQEERMLKDNLHRGQWDYEILQTLDFDQIELAEIGFEGFEIAFDTEPDVNQYFAKIDENDSKNKLHKLIFAFEDENDYSLVTTELAKYGETPEEALKNLLNI